ncbi:MAG: hypothetical protein AB8B55_00350 [Mariniblastus sp.]
MSAQLGGFTTTREWTDKTGKFKTFTKLESVTNDVLVLELNDGSKKTLKPSVLSQPDLKFLGEYREAFFKQAESKAKALVLSRDILKHYNALLKTKFLSNENQKVIDERVRQLELEIFSGKIVTLPSGPITQEELQSKKDKASDLVGSWIKDVKTRDAKDADVLRDAIKIDPTSLEASVLLAIYYEIHEYKHTTAQRHLADAIRRGKKYMAIASESDLVNLIAALNNLAVSHARQNQISKAIKLWSEADEIVKRKLPAPVFHNVAKLRRVLNRECSGITGNRSEENATYKFSSLLDANGSPGGWQFICPVSSDGTVRNNIEFMLTAFSSLESDTINETRCVACDGKQFLRCTAGLCKNGKIKLKVWGDTIFVHPSGTRQKIGRQVVGFNLIDCKACRGTGKRTCPCCRKGHQKN